MLHARVGVSICGGTDFLLKNDLTAEGSGLEKSQPSSCLDWTKLDRFSRRGIAPLQLQAAIRHSLCFITLLPFVACMPTKTITRDELRSDLLSALSLASQTELFINQIEQDRVTRQFQSTHADYLQDEALRQAKHLRESRAGSGDATTVGLSAGQLDHLAGELALISVRKEKERLPGIAQRVEAIRNALAEAEVGL